MSRDVSRPAYKFTSPSTSLALLVFGCVLEVTGVRALLAGEVETVDRLGTHRVFRGEYATLYAWFFVVAGAALLVAALLVFVAVVRKRMSHETLL